MTEIQTTCWQCLGYGYPPATLTRFNKVDAEICPTCQGTGMLAEEKPKPKRGLFWVCWRCGCKVPATEMYCSHCLAPKE